MVMRSALIPVHTTAGVTVQNQLLFHEPGYGRLLVLMPGRNFSCDRPVLHYIRTMALQIGFDVLSIRYGFQVNDTTPNDGDLIHEVTDASALVMEEGYREVCFVGKSLGSPLALTLARQAQVPEVSVILLTPIPEALGPVAGIRALAVIGTADPYL